MGFLEVLQKLDLPMLKFLGVITHRLSADEPFNSHIGDPVAIALYDRTSYSLYAIPPQLHPDVVKAHKPISVPAFGAQFAVERLDKAAIDQLARPREVENDATLIRSQIEVTWDEL